MKTSELPSNRACECRECGDKLRPIRAAHTNLCRDCEQLLADLDRVDRERELEALLNKPWWWFHNPLNAKAFRDAQKGVRS